MKNVSSFTLFILAGILLFFVNTGVTISAAAPYKETYIENFKKNLSLRYNDLRHFHGVSIQEPAQAKMGLKNNKAIIQYNKLPGGLAGFYTNLAEDNKGSFDASRYDDLEIQGFFPEDLNFSLNIVGPQIKKKTGESHTIPLRDYLVTENTYLFPLSSFPEIDLSKVASIRILADTPSSGIFSIEEIKLIDYNPPQQITTVPGQYMIDDFNNSTNRFGNKDLFYYLAPSSITIKRQPKRNSQQDRCLKITALNRQNGWSVYANPFLQDQNFFNAENYKSLIFKVRGEKGGEDATIAISDKNRNTRKTPWTAGKLSSYLNHPVSTKWEQVVVPLQDFGPIPIKQIREFLLIFPGDEPTTLYIDELSLSTLEFTKVKTSRDIHYLLQGFSAGLKNGLGNELQILAEKPSLLEVDTTLEGAVANNDPCLKIDYKKTPENYCGFAVPLKEKDKYFSAADYEQFGFQARGQGSVVLEIYFIDQYAEKASKENLPVTFKRVTIRNLTGQWQWVTIPLKDFEVDTKNLSAIIFNFPERGKGTLYIDNISFLQE